MTDHNILPHGGKERVSEKKEQPAPLKVSVRWPSLEDIDTPSQFADRYEVRLNGKQTSTANTTTQAYLLRGIIKRFMQNLRGETSKSDTKER